MKRKLKGTRKKYQISKIIAKNTLKGVKIGVLSTFTAAKTAILATKALIATIVAGGWVAVLIIIFLCLRFIGWLILSLFTFGVLLLYVLPYMSAITFLFYEKIYNENKMFEEIK